MRSKILNWLWFLPSSIAGSLFAMTLYADPMMNHFGAWKLPNSEVNSGTPDEAKPSKFAKRIATRFPLEQFPPQRGNPGLLKLASPLHGQPVRFINRFGTLAVEFIFGYEAFLHNGLDYTRVTLDDDDTVYAPVAGWAAFVCDGDEGAACPPYHSSIAILDDDSHLFVSLLHLDADINLRQAPAPFRVTRGEALGRIAVRPDIPEKVEVHNRHTHLSVIDRTTLRYVNPTPYAKGYEDHRPPNIIEVYLLSDNAKPTHQLSNEIDVVVEVSDMDDSGTAHFEANTLSYRITDDEGNLLLQSSECRLDEVLTRRGDGTNDLLSMFDLGSAIHKKVGNVERNVGAQSAKLERTFRYAINHIQASPDGACIILNDKTNFVRIAPSVTSIKVEGLVGDHLGNYASFESRFFRNGSNN